MIKYIDVDQKAIADRDPNPINIRIRTPMPSPLGEFACLRAREVLISGPSEIRYCPVHPQPFGARVWVQTDSPIMYKSSELLDWQRVP